MIGRHQSVDRGAATVEFVLVVPVVVLVLVTLVEVVAVARAQFELLGAARQGARVAATNPDPVHAVNAVQAALGETVTADAIITVDRPAVVGRPATVQLELRHRVLSGLFGGIPVHLVARAVMRVER